MKPVLGSAFFLACVTTLAAVVACGSNSNDSPGGEGDGSGDGGAFGAESGVFSSSVSDDASADAFAACATSQQDATLKPVNLVFLYDKSGSMGDRTRDYTCGNQTVLCVNFTVTGPSTYQEYVCFPSGQDQKLAFFGKGTVEFNGNPCPAGKLGSDDAILCTNPSACTLADFNDPAAKWIPVNQAAEAFFADAKSTGMSASLGFFPKFNGNQTLCQSSDYATPSVTMRALPDATDFKAAIAAQSPLGSTPTQVALTGAISYARTIATAKPAEVTAIVLVTDGDPTDCGGANGQAISVVKGVAAGAANDPKQPIKTYVIGVGSSLSNLNEIAAGGGTTKATLVSTTNPAQTSADFRAALDQIRGQELSCNVALPTPPDGKQLDINAVNVIVSHTGAADEVLSYNKDCTGGTGWHYDNANAPKEVELCDASCAAVRSGGGKLAIAFGCATKGGVIR